MTEYQARQICDLRSNGAGYKVIANMTGLSRDIVRNYCKSHGLAGVLESSDGNFAARLKEGLVCKNCGAPIVPPHTGRRRLFCSKNCRFSWWRVHAAESRNDSKANYRITCAHCGQEFISYGNRKRKYCCHACFVQDRRDNGTWRRPKS